MANKKSSPPAVTPQEIVRLDEVLVSSGRLMTGEEMAKRGGRYRLVSRRALVGQLLELVDSFVVERIRQAERELGRILEDREKDAKEDGQHRVLVSLAELSDLVDAIVSKIVDKEGALAAKALDRRIDRLFKSYGFQRIPTVGLPFNSILHEAIDELESSNVDSGSVIEEVSRGYERDGFVLRVARVVVAS